MALTSGRGNHLRQVAWGSFVVAHARLTRLIDAEMTAAGVLPLEWYDVLLPVYEAPGRRLRLSELAERALVTRSGLTRLVDRIEAKGLLARERCTDDRRGAFAVLTDPGLEALRRSWPKYEALIEEHFGRHMSDEDAATVHRVFSRMLPPPPVREGDVVQVTVSHKRRGPRTAPATAPLAARPPRD